MEILWARAYLPLGGVKLNYTLTGCQAERQRISQPTPRLASVNYDFLLFALLAGKGLQFCPQWSVAPYLRRGELMQVLPDLIPEPDQFGSKVHVIYPVHSAIHASTRLLSSASATTWTRRCFIDSELRRTL